MNDIKKIKLNVVCSLVLQIAVFCSGLILPRLFIQAYGSKTNGLISSIQQFLGFITLGEMGIGAVIQYNLYKPLAESNWKDVSQIMASSKRFFNRLLIAIVIYIAVLATLLPFKTIDEFDYIFTASLVVSISISYIAQYYFGMTYKQLLDADQLSFVRIIPQIIQVVINVFVCCYLINAKVDVRLVKFTTSILYCIQPLTIMVFSRIHYPQINSKEKIAGEPIKQKWNGIAQHLAAVVLKDTDVVVLTLFSTLENVSIYAVYNMIIYGIETLIEAVTNNFTAVFGRLLAQNNITGFNKSFEKFEILFHLAMTFVFSCIMVLIIPFITVYTNEINDANYIVPVFACVITIAHWLYSARLPYHILIKAAGHYKETQGSAIIEAMINIVISVLTVYKFGLIGVAFGTACAMFYRSVYYLMYLSKHILKRNFWLSIRFYVIDIISFALIMMITASMKMTSVSFVAWFIFAIKVSAVAFVAMVIVNLIFNFRKIKRCFLTRKN